MKILITAGGTREFIDDIRVLTNISTGKLGSKIADYFINADSPISSKDKDEIYFVHGINSELPYFIKKENCYAVDSVSDLMKTLEKLVPQMDIVIHAMAVSDFTFEKKEDIKLKSNDPQSFVDYLKNNIKINPKVISYIKKWNPNVKLVGFKFEVGLSNKKLIDIAHESLLRNNCDLVVANDKIEIDSIGDHVAYIIKKDKSFERIVGRYEIAQKIKENI